nr:hypothetical protein B0A51_16576 [Rachicladosporium sp. CCFEE 5018]
MESNSSRAPRVGHKKSRKGCAQCKRRHVKCNEESPCTNCQRHGVACSLAGGPNVPRDDAKPKSVRSGSGSSGSSRLATRDTLSREGSFNRANSYSGGAASSQPTFIPTPTPSHGGGNSPGGDWQDYNAIRVLTGSVDRTIAPAGQASMLDLELMHHFMTHYFDVMTENFGMDLMWQSTLPQLGITAPYVMHGLLGFSALHMASIAPERAPLLHAAAVKHLDQALVSFREDCGPSTAENADAKFAFTWIVALFAFAIPPAVPPVDALVELFSLVKGMKSVAQDTMIWVAQGPFAPMLSDAFSDGSGVTADGLILDFSDAFAPGNNNQTSLAPLPEGFDFGLNHLDFMIGMGAMIPEERRTCAVILAELKQLYTTVSKKRTQHCAVSAIVCFPQADPTAFISVIRRRRPQALVILAYYTVLLDLLDSRWWLQGWGRGVLRDVVANLGDEWKSWIEWPVQTVLMKTPPVQGGGAMSMDSMHVI